MDLSDTRLIERLCADLPMYARHALTILDKSGKQQRLILNRAQQYIHDRLEKQLAEQGRVRALILKSRQQGSSTYVAARFYHKTSTKFGQRAFIVAHEQKATDNLFSMVKRYHDNNPLKPSTGATNAKELVFDRLDGGYKLATAGSKDVGRSNTAQLLHGCLGAGALVMMYDGSLRAIETLEPGDVVRTKAGVAAPVKGISWHSDQTRTLKIAMNGVPIRATDNHKFWTRNGMVPVSELRVGDELGFPVRHITEEISSVPFSCELSKRKQGGGRSEKHGPESIALTFELGRMLGLYLAEGYIALQTKEPHEPGSVVFACHERELERNSQWIRAICHYSSLNERENKGSKTRMTVAYGRQFAAFVMRMCGRKEGKHLPHEWWRMPREFVRGLLVGYLAGDGHCSQSRDRRIQAPSIVPAITYGMRDVVAALGFGFPSVSYREPGVRHGRNEKAQYTLRITGGAVDSIAPMLGWKMPPRKRTGNSQKIENGFAWLAIESIGDLSDEMVWDIEVDHPDHDYCLTQCATSNSEFGFWDNAESHLAGIGSCVADIDGTEIILESTANGINNKFHQLWQDAEAGRGEWTAIFVPWMWQQEYRAPVPEGFELTAEEVEYKNAYGCDLEQMVWRRNKVVTYGHGFEWLFDQEYPAVPNLAFRSPTADPIISPALVTRAMKSNYKDMHGPLIIGCDPAEFGDDRTAIVFRRGRVCYRIETYEKQEPMEVANRLARYHTEFSPDAMFVDKIGIGAGIVSRLRELGVPVIGINSGERASEPDLYVNQRAEMWYRMQEWFQDQPCRIPNDMALASDLSGPSIKYNAESRKKMVEKKEDMKRRGIRSPDLGDALAISFASTVVSRDNVEYAGRYGSHKAATIAGY